MSEQQRWYVAIDLKSFYASVECVERGYDPLRTNLVVADKLRTEKTICLAVSPSLKAYGIPGRARLFEVVSHVKEANSARKVANGGRQFTGTSFYADELDVNPSLAIDYVVAPPQMAHYIQVSTQIYDIYLRFVSAEDMHIYSVDEIFADVTSYLHHTHMSPRQMAEVMMQAVYDETGITATAGVGTNMYLAKIAMDIVAKHMEPDANGARLAVLDEMSYRQLLWEHQPLTDFWRVGKGYAKKLNANGLYTMGDVARCSLGAPGDYYNEDLLYRLFGVNAELLIDHAWGYEPCTIAQVKAYRPVNNSLSSGQVLTEPYTAAQARVVVQEMVDAVALDLVEKNLVTDQIVLTVGYDIENLIDPKRAAKYKGEITVDGYGRRVPKHAHGTANLLKHTSSGNQMIEATLALYDQIVNSSLLVRRITIAVNHVMSPSRAQAKAGFEQLSFFTDIEQQQAQQAQLEREHRMQEAMLFIKKRYGKNAVLKGTNFKDGATMRERNGQIGGHKA